MQKWWGRRLGIKSFFREVKSCRIWWHECRQCKKRPRPFLVRKTHVLKRPPVHAKMSRQNAAYNIVSPVSAEEFALQQGTDSLWNLESARAFWPAALDYMLAFDPTIALCNALRHLFPCISIRANGNSLKCHCMMLCMVKLHKTDPSLACCSLIVMSSLGDRRVVNSNPSISIGNFWLQVATSANKIPYRGKVCLQLIKFQPILQSHFSVLGYTSILSDHCIVQCPTPCSHA